MSRKRLSNKSFIKKIAIVGVQNEIFFSFLCHGVVVTIQEKADLQQTLLNIQQFKNDHGEQYGTDRSHQTYGGLHDPRKVEMYILQKQTFKNFAF